MFSLFQPEEYHFKLWAIKNNVPKSIKPKIYSIDVHNTINKRARIRKSSQVHNNLTLIKMLINKSKRNNSSLVEEIGRVIKQTSCQKRISFLFKIQNKLLTSDRTSLN